MVQLVRFVRQMRAVFGPLWRNLGREALELMLEETVPRRCFAWDAVRGNPLLN